MSFKRRNRIVNRIQLKLGLCKKSFRFFHVRSKFLGVVKPKLNVNSLFSFQKFYCALCLCRFLFKRYYLRFYLGKNVVDTSHIILGCRKFSLTLTLFMSIFCNTRGILKDSSSFIALLRNNIGNSSLTYNRISVTSYTGIHKQLINVAKTNSSTIYIIFTFTRAVITTSYGYLVIRTIKSAYHSRIVKSNGNLGITHRTSAICSSEDYILHLRTTQAL